jgi:hypothetical protein
VLHPAFSTGSAGLRGGGWRFRRGQRWIEPIFKKRANGACDFLRMGLQGEVPGIEQADFGVGEVALKSFSARRQKIRIVLAPYRQKRRLMRPEIFVKSWIKSDVAAVVQEEAELHVMRAWTSEVEIIQGATVG